MSENNSTKPDDRVITDDSYPKSIDPYTHFAAPYAATNEPQFSERMAEFVINHLRPFGFKSGGHIVDLSCGVGAACVAFHKLGYKVTGVDLSQKMIHQAIKRALDGGADINFFSQDMRSLSVETKAELITCMYDSLNFMLTENDLAQVFQRVAGSLANEGFFVFDVYTIKGLSELWGNQVEIHTDTPDHFIASRTEWDADSKINTKTMHGFSRKGDLWEKWNEVHVSRAYELKTITGLLNQTGLIPVEALDWECPLKKSADVDTRRVVFVAKKM